MSDRKRFTVSLYEHAKSPFWWATCYLEGEEGKKHRFSTGVAIGADRRVSAREATRAADDRAARLAAAIAPTSGDTPPNALFDVAERMLESKRADGTRPRAVDGLEFWLDKHVIPFMGRGRDVTTIRRADLEGLKAHLRTVHNDRTNAPGLSAQSINNALTAIRQVLKFAWAVEETIESVPMVANVKAHHAPPHALTLEQADALIASIDPRAVEARHFYLFTANTGLRKQEVLSIRFSWVDWEHQLMKIPAEHMKGGRARPIVALNDATIKVLRERLALHPKRKDPQDDRVFRQGKHDSARNSAAARAGLGKVRGHDLRHTLGSLHVAAGATLTEVRDTLGHRGLEIVSHYQHSYIDRRQETARLVQITGNAPPATPTKASIGSVPDGVPGEQFSRGGNRRDSTAPPELPDSKAV